MLMTFKILVRNDVQDPVVSVLCTLNKIYLPSAQVEFVLKNFATSQTLGLLKWETFAGKKTYVNHEKKTYDSPWNTGCVIRILIMVYENNPHITR